MAADLSVFSRPLGGTEENWMRSTAGGTGIVVFGAIFSRLIGTECVTEAVQELLDCHPVLRAQIVENPKGKPCYQVPETCLAAGYIHEKPWPSVEGVDLSGIIMFSKDHHVDKHGSVSLHKLVTEEISITFTNPEGKSSPPLPLFQVLIYHNRSEHHTIILLKLHGAALDRTSARNVCQVFLDKLNLAVEGRLHQSKSVKGENALPAPLEDFIPKGKASKGFFQKGFDVVGYATNSSKQSLLPFSPEFSGATKARFESNIVGISLGREGTETFFDSCKRENVTWTAALSAAFLKTTAELKELKEKKQDEFGITFVLDCRAYLEPTLPETALGNYTLGIPRGEKVKEGIEFWDLARQVHASIEKDISKSKHFSEMSVLGLLFSQVMKHPNVTPKSSLRTALLNIFAEPPLDTHWKGVDELNLVGTLGPFSSMHFAGPCFCVAESLSEGPELTISLVYPTPVHSRPQMLEMLQSSVNLLLKSCANS
ncbi:hypothetical protein KP509_22G023700 [Ceratopteris richardii]|uniref:Phthiocerol/phthiodiolone dimycocerosyl transferase C-terminal domain-containing protein n=1 Tax=Ceratopteris richardii TaxID=49495 RepID=A0A8T2S5E7_CERRI|nr:hypothetical protein KP509_22G023700 [Ceratopteris richardii]KAH7306654.1 hypothetical protein KP509_22G023700 [Ceratopteris richardii]KAH7306655.1 hypothetical protein KP509_22G023700 [Ceratopteris richardii]KAH7306656.1 hypothetical protein KP509_22G023700 [Ceratopteris richardii]KAH7306657.1 hypothetical protein KP509_22G023700 [Ceratopteris richardii]